MNRILALLMALALLICPMAGLAEETPAVRVAALKGPTAMGLVKLMQDDEAGNTVNDYEFVVEATSDAVTPLLLKGELDVAMVPCNLASVLYNKSEGALQMAAINTLGVLYVVECGQEIQTAADLKGRTIYTTGQGTTPEYALRFVLSGNGIDPDRDVTIEFLSEAAEVAAALVNDAASVAVLPQPYVMGALSQNEGARIALSLTEEWAKVDPKSAMITGVCLVRRDFAESRRDALAAFLSEYAASTEYVNAHPEEAAPWIEALGIGKAAVIEKALPMCNIVCITGQEMATLAGGYLQALYDQNPKSVGGALPDEAFYYGADN